MRITVLAGGIGGSRFLRGLLRALETHAGGDNEVTVIGNTGDDIWIHGLRVCPDLDTVMYTLGGGISAERGWGREDETFTVREELAAYGVEPTWFGLGDRDIATHLIRTQSLGAGFTLTEVTQALCDRWQPGVRLLPMSDNRAETHVVVDDPSGATTPDDAPLRIALHFQEWWIRYGAKLPAHEFILVGGDTAEPGPDVIASILEADLILLPPSNPVVSIGTILQIDGIAEAIRATAAPVVGVSPIIGGAPVRGMADACLTAIGVPTTAAGVAEHYGARTDGGILDTWVIDTADADSAPEIASLGIECVVTSTLMTDLDAAATLAQRCLAAPARA